jgi:predicted regulator of Ras-like GTPase activity (Roadblock/LC7/MglB family)
MAIFRQNIQPVKSSGGVKLRQDDLVIYQEQIDDIERTLRRLIKDAQAKCVLLVDKDGHLITRQGFTQSLDTTALAALLAGSFASTQEIARLVGEPEFSVLFHQGKKDHIHITLVGERSILAVIFDDRTTIGMVRLYAKEIAEDLNQILSSEKQEESQSKNEPGKEVDTEFSSTVETRLDDIFSDKY